MTSLKYIFALSGKHIFNPVAIAIFLTAVIAGQPASWWIGNSVMLPFVLIGGLLVARKVRREEMLSFFFIATFVTVGIFTLIKGSDLFSIFQTLVFTSPLFFFAFVMLTEPLTSPTEKKMQNVYAILVGILFAPQFSLLGYHFTPEAALLVGNIFSYIVTPREKFVFDIVRKLKLAPDTFDFIFPLKSKFSYIPGQYMEWTLPHPNTDSRGNRRYFTLASSPTEDNLRIGVKFGEPPSSYKREMLKESNFKIVAGQRAGDFLLPKDKNQKLVLIAGGIGVTPYRSMIKYLLDNKEARDIVLIYSCRSKGELVYRDVFDEAKKELGIKVYYTLTDVNNIPNDWEGLSGRVNKDTLLKLIPDYASRTFYISGPHTMIVGFKKVLSELKVAKSRIKEDFFPGFT